MRVTGGTLGGRKILAPKTGTRPALDRVREAVFSALATCTVDVRVVDLFAGSGAYGIEAWSRGAASVCWVEQDGTAISVLRKNVKTLGIDKNKNAQVVRADVWKWLAQTRSMEVDLVFADPPYQRREEEGQAERLMQVMVEYRLLREGGLLVYEQGKREPVIVPEGWVLLRDRTYARTRSLIYRKEDGAGRS